MSGFNSNAKHCTPAATGTLDPKQAGSQCALLEFAMDRIQEEAYLVGQDGRFHYVNGAATRSLGYSREELLRMSVPDINPDFTPVSWEIYLRDHGGGFRNFEARHKAKDGRVFPVEISACTFEYAGANYRLALVRDISARKQAEEERRRGEERRIVLEFALDRVQEAAFLTDVEDGARFLYANAEASRLLGYSREELLRMSIPDIDPDYTLERLHREFRGKLHPITHESRHKCKDGRIFPVEIKSNSFEYDGKHYNVCFVSDISERKRQEARRLAHLRYFECMDRVNRAIQGAACSERMMESVLDATLAAFDCDRAWIVSPHGPRALVERTKPDYPGALELECPFDETSVQTMLQAGGPVQFQENEGWLAADLAKRLGIKSQISMAICPEGSKPWLFSLHQCSAKRIWTPAEEGLFQEIGRRLGDALTGLLTHRGLRESEQKYREVFDNVSDALTLYDVAAGPRFILADMNPSAERIIGISKAEAVGKVFEDIFPEKIAAHALPLLRQCVESGEVLCCEEEFELVPGARSLHTIILPVRNESGSIYRLIVFNRDISELKRAGEERQLLMREVHHRSKNLLAVVQAVVRQTAGEADPKLFEQRLNERIAALAASHDLLVSNDWRGADMHSLATAQLAHFKDLIGSRIVLAGPPALLMPAACQALGMALHELATNASKYGALSGASGSIRLEWEITAGDEHHFKIRWSERGGPPPKQPERQGFGHKVIVQMAAHALDAEVSLTYPSSGLVWELTAPAACAIEV
jgi:PAS domain S-box-containing protein